MNFYGAWTIQGKWTLCQGVGVDDEKVKRMYIMKQNINTKELTDVELEVDVLASQFWDGNLEEISKKRLKEKKNERDKDLERNL